MTGKPYNEILDAVRDGTIRALWIVATNPAHSWIDQNSFHALRDQLDFLVVQDMYHSTETARTADLLLPAAGWGEKEGTFINSERRVGLIKKVRRAGIGTLGLSYHQTRGALLRLRRPLRGVGFARSGLPDLEATLGRSTVRLRRNPRLSHAGRGRRPSMALPRRQSRPGNATSAVHRPHVLPRRWPRSFVFENPRVMAEDVDDDYPFLLLTGRGGASQWHTQTRTAKSDVLRKLDPPGSRLEIHPRDAAALALAPDKR